MAPENKPVYCVDSSTLMNFEDKFPQDIFVGLWDDLGELVQSSRLVSHREVYEEIQQGSGFLTNWAKQHRQIFVEHTTEQAELIGQIVDRSRRCPAPTRPRRTKRTPGSSPCPSAKEKA